MCFGMGQRERERQRMRNEPGIVLTRLICVVTTIMKKFLFTFWIYGLAE